MESKCIICGKVFEAKNAKGVLCSPSCRSRNHRKIKKERLFLLNNNSNFSNSPISVNQIQLNHIAINNYCIENNCTWVDLIECHKNVNKKIFNAPQIEIKGDEFRIPPQPIEKVDYQKLLNDCEFPDEFKNLWEKIKADANLSEKERIQWKVRLNAK